MKYLLSSGRTTFNKLAYIKDLLSLNLLLSPNEVPYNNTGTSDLIAAINSDDITNRVRKIVNDSIVNITSKNSDVKMTIRDIKVMPKVIRVELNINNSIENYDIQR